MRISDHHWETCQECFSREEALEYVFGYTCANDVSARKWQKHGGGGQWCRGKSFDTFCPLGPCIVTVDEIPNPNNLNIKTLLNGNTMQDWTTSDMIFDVPSLISFLSQGTTLLPGTVIHDRDTAGSRVCTYAASLSQGLETK